MDGTSFFGGLIWAFIISACVLWVFFLGNFAIDRLGPTVHGWMQELIARPEACRAIIGAECIAAISEGYAQ